MADVESLELQITGDATSAKQSLDALIKTLGLLTQATSGGCGLSAVALGLQQVSNSGQAAAASNSKSSKSFAKLATKITAAALTLKKAGKIVASWIKESNDYVENVNLFTVAMGEYAGSAKQYAEEVGEMMGIDPSDWMRSQGVFMTLATGFGVATDRAATLSQQLTQLGYDISSFYNISVEDAMQKLQSGISGELEPLRRLGYDLSQAKLEATALSLGIDKAVSSMTQAEKAELRYYAIMTQVTTAQGDMARTLNAPANQLRIFSAQASQAARALGDLFIPALNAILPVAIAVLKVITALAKVIAKLFGSDFQGDMGSGMGGLASNAGSAGDAIEDATGSAKKLKKTLLGIDELNVMPDLSGGGGDTDGAGGGGGFDFELPTYDFIGEMTETRVAQIVEDMMEWLGISEDINSWAELMDTRFGSILKTVVLIGVGIASWKVAAWAFGLEMDNIKSLFSDMDKLKGVAGSVLGVVGAVMQLMGAWDAWQNGMDWKNLGEQIAGVGIAIGGLALSFGSIGAGIASIVGGIIMTITSVKDWLTNGVDWDNFVGVMVGLAAIFGGISVLVGSWIPMAIGAVVATITAVVMWWDQIAGFFTTLWDGIVTWCGTACEAIGLFFVNLWSSISTGITAVIQFFVNLWNGIVTWCENACTSIGLFFDNLWLGICTVWGVVAEWFNTNVVQPVVNFFLSLWQTITTVFSPVIEWFSQLFGSVFQTISDIFYNIGVIVTGCWEIIKAAWELVSEWFDTEVIQPVADFFKTKWDEITALVINAWESIKFCWAAVSGWFNNKIIQPVATFFQNLWSGIVTKATTAWNNITSFVTEAWSNIETVLFAGYTWIDTKIIQPISKLFSNLWDGFIEKAKLAWEGVKTVFAKVASFFRETFEKAWQGIVNVFSIAGEIFVDIKDAILSGFKTIVNGIIGGLNRVISVPFSGINSALATIRGINIFGLTPFSDLKTISVPSIPYLAEGGVVDTGQMFVANEAGPELVGNVGRKTAVMNNDQIVDAVSRGVYQAVVAAMGGSNSNQVVEAKVNDKVLFEVMVSRARQETVRTGYNPLLGGA